ncbi:hypothetical protein [Brevibacillus reuszeri]|uniref:hypothetical protein n=1 Tax=Brevibacillus reuszeri TaxID=54915 RepID=UPI003D215E90
MSLTFSSLINPMNLVDSNDAHFYINEQSLKLIDTNNLTEYANFVGFSMAAKINGCIITAAGTKITNSANSSNGFAVPYLYEELTYYTVVVFSYLCYQAKIRQSATIELNVKRLANRFNLSKTKVTEALAELLIHRYLRIDYSEKKKVYVIPGLEVLYPNKESVPL